MIWIGVDEAGYGPNLGPLVCGASIWRVADDSGDADLYSRLEAAVSSARPRVGTATDGRLWLADSKVVYGANHDLGELETGVLAAARACGVEAATRDGLFRELAGVAPAVEEVPWYGGDENLPVAADAGRIAQGARALREACESTGADLLGIRAAAVFPRRWNQLLSTHATKAEVLSGISLRLVRECLAAAGDEPAVVWCDKHGGRNHYAALIQHEFPDCWVRVLRESAESSVYRWEGDRAAVEIRFQPRCESQLPTALASMTAKYLRELAMADFNRFWIARVDGLEPTAGYPTDARRFHRQIRAAQAELQIGDADLWRAK